MYKNYRINDIENNLTKMSIRPLDVIVTGVTGAGKSTTLNTFFQRSIAKVGEGVEPETMNLKEYSLNSLFRLWDTPGLGDGVHKDIIHSKKIIELLHKTYDKDSKVYGYIDLVLVVIDGTNRDMGTTYKLLNEVIVPNFQKKRILVAINQADMAMKGRHWDSDLSIPKPKLLQFLEEKTISIQKRVYEATGVKIIKPVYYSAKNNYNINQLFDLLIDNMPQKRRKLKFRKSRKTVSA